jgi:TPR repeat protein
MLERRLARFTLFDPVRTPRVHGGAAADPFEIALRAPHFKRVAALGLLSAFMPGLAQPLRASPVPTLAPPSAAQTIRKPADGGPDLAFGAFQRGYFATALKEASRRIADDPADGAAMALIGEIYDEGLAVRRDLKEAAAWFRLAGEHGNREGLFKYGMALLEGRGVDPDRGAARHALEQAAALGHGGALYNLGVLALQGNGVAHDFKSAAVFFQGAADAGDIDALFALANLYRTGQGVDLDLAHAVKLYKAAADAQDPAAQVEYAIMAFNGEGMSKDEAMAAKYFQRAATGGNPVAANRLARLFAAGRGIAKNLVEAARWHLLARAKGIDDPWLDTLLTDLTAGDRLKVEAELRKTLGN